MQRLYLILKFARTPEFVVLSGPGINLSEYRHRIPDIVVVRADGFLVAEVFEARPPLLAVEVASRRARLYDRTRKKTVYEQYGIESYWIVNPDVEQPDITAFPLLGGKYEQAGYAIDEKMFTTQVPFPVSFAPAQLLSTEPLR
ncbi:Uma2 family endonuclease [Trebonia sp.]|uniref:Uma2 family endonuclease n=1 Tax=Trebonia sp. TaxID=2767075 RepID=UPI002609BF9A|nr:Uma2 family endonuclease [Trebonia sp.]